MELDLKGIKESHLWMVLRELTNPDTFIVMQTLRTSGNITIQSLIELTSIPREFITPILIDLESVGAVTLSDNHVNITVFGTLVIDSVERMRKEIFVEI